ncbi:hypothetical protein [Propionivibrio sp.]|uniref:hypothetical protein n=1 Tax=Propionivibrio sp. TaxID=2212460 RepID=UPI00262CFDAE|nr:hypothetical protein [Propionivibrio sp.]
MNTKLVQASTHVLLGPAEEAAEYLTKAAGRIERNTVKELAPGLPEIIQAIFKRFKWPTKIQLEFVQACQQLNALEAAYLEFLKLPSAEKRAAMKIFQADQIAFHKSVSTLKKSAEQLAKEDKKVLLEAIKSMEEHVTLRSAPVEATGRGLVGAGHLVPERVANNAAKKIAKPVAQHVPDVLKRIEKALMDSKESLRYPNLLKWVNVVGSLENASLRKALEKILRRLDGTGKPLLKMSPAAIRRELGKKYKGLQSALQGPIGEGVALTQNVTRVLRERALGRALSHELGLVDAGWVKASVDDAVRVTKLNGNVSGEWFDGSDWLYRFDAPPKGVGKEMDEIAATMQSEMSTEIDGVAFTTFGLESKAGSAAEVIEQFNKAGARAVFGVVELPIPGLNRPGRFLIVPPPGFQTEILLLAPHVPAIKNLPADIALSTGLMPLTQKEFQTISKELIELVSMARSGR